MTSTWLEAATGGSENCGGWPPASARPFAISSCGSDRSTKSDNEWTSRVEASHAPGGGVPLQPVPFAHSVTQTAPSFWLLAAGNNVVATSALATGTGT